MKFSRLAAFVAVPVALSLAACTGGSTGTIANVSGNTANVRVINGNPALTGAVDVYFQSTGSAAPSQPVITNLAYAVASDYLTQPAVQANIIIQGAGGQAPSTGAKQITSCPIPQLAINAKYSVVIVNAGGGPNCELFQDFDYTGAPQYRPHDAAHVAALATNASFGIIPSASAAPGTPFSVQVTVPQGTLAASGSGAATSFTAAQPQSIPAFSGSITFAVGQSGSNPSTSLATLDSRYIFSPNGKTQPNTTGALNFTGTAGTSIFALDCTATVAPNVGCNAGVALVGYTDRL